MKKFILKYKAPIAIVVLLALFIILSILVGDIKVKVGEDVSEWMEETKKDEYIVTVYASSTCGNCANHRPVMEKLQKEYGFKLYWFELDELTASDSKAVTEEYDISDYDGRVPFTFVMKDGKYLGNILGAQGEEAVVEFLKEQKVIE